MPDKKGLYLDRDTNQKNEFETREDKVVIKVDHGDHTHDLDISNVPLEDMYKSDKETNTIFGDAHTKAGHTWKDEKKDEDEDEDENK